MGQGRSSNSVDNLYLKYRQSNFKNRMPLGFTPWISFIETNNISNKRLQYSLFIIVFLW